MKTDTQLLLIFQNNPKMLKDLLNLDAPGPYRLKSEELKQLARTADGVFDYETAEIAYIIEFQGQPETFIYHRGELERIMYSMLHPEKKVVLIIVFLQKALDPKTEPWSSLNKTGNPYYRVLYLEEILRALAERDPNHPLLAVFQPFLINDDEKLKREAATYYQAIRKAPIDDAGKQALLGVFESWIVARFKKMTQKEIMAMLAVMGNIEDSVAYKEIKEEGREEGWEEGREVGIVQGSINNLEKLLAEGILSKNEFEKRTAPLKKQLAELQTKYKPE